MTQMATEREEDLTAIWDSVEEHDIPCDFYGHAYGCRGEPAKWILFLVKCPQCGKKPGPHLACDRCKRMRLESSDGVYCACGLVFAPARIAYTRCEAL